MAEHQAAHRQVLEDTVIRGDDRRATHGLYIGGLIAVIVAVFAFVLILRGRSVAGFTTLLGEVGTLSALFVYGHVQRRKEREAKARMLAATAQEPSPQLPFPDG